MKVLETFKAKQAFYERFYKLLKQSKQEVMKSFINFYSKASKVSRKCLVKDSFYSFETF